MKTPAFYGLPVAIRHAESIHEDPDNRRFDRKRAKGRDRRAERRTVRDLKAAFLTAVTRPVEVR